MIVALFISLHFIQNVSQLIYSLFANRFSISRMIVCFSLGSDSATNKVMAAESLSFITGLYELAICIFCIFILLFRKFGA